MPYKVGLAVAPRRHEGNIVANGQQVNQILGFLDSVAKILGSGISGSNERIYHTHNLLHRRHNFLIGISIDGPEDIHNHYRRDKGGAPTFSRVINGISLLRSGSVEFNKRNDLPMKCLRCEYLFACNGECPKHRFNRTDTGDTGLSALCSGYYKFYKHVAPYMERMRTLLSEKRAPAELAIELKISRLARVRRSHL